jgi:TolB-like protein
VRKSGARLRVAARLIRADNGYVVWSDTYDRPFDDILMVQDDIERNKP